MVCYQNKGLSEYQRRAGQLHSGPSPTPGGREAGVQQPEPVGKGLLQSRPQRQHTPPNCEQAPVANHVFLGSLIVDIFQEGCSLGSAPQRRLMAHQGNRVAGTRKVIRIHGPPGTLCSPSTWSSELLGPGKGTKCMPNQVCALAEHPGA